MFQPAQIDLSAQAQALESARRELHRHEAAFREAARGKDLSAARLRPLREAVIAARLRVSRLAGEPPPHTD